MDRTDLTDARFVLLDSLILLVPISWLVVIGYLTVRFTPFPFVSLLYWRCFTPSLFCSGRHHRVCSFLDLHILPHETDFLRTIYRTMDLVFGEVDR